MDGWVGTFWDLKHVGVTPDLDAILAQDQGKFCFPERLGAVCAECDHLHLVCDQCRFRHVTWANGHAAYIGQGSRDSEDAIEIAGWRDWTNPSHFEAATGSTSVAAVFQVLGVSTQQARDLIREHLSQTQATNTNRAPSTPSETALVPVPLSCVWPYPGFDSAPTGSSYGGGPVGPGCRSFGSTGAIVFATMVCKHARMCLVFGRMGMNWWLSWNVFRAPWMPKKLFS